MTMRVGDQVSYVKDPLLFGVGEIEAVLTNGMLLVVFPDEPRPAIFDPHELEVYTKSLAA